MNDKNIILDLLEKSGVVSVSKSNQNLSITELVEIMEREMNSGRHIIDIVKDLNTKYNTDIENLFFDFDDQSGMLEDEDYLRFSDNLSSGNEPFLNNEITKKYFRFVRMYV